jgi:hypothetical protein
MSLGKKFRNEVVRNNKGMLEEEYKIATWRPAERQYHSLHTQTLLPLGEIVPARGWRLILATQLDTLLW